MVLNAVVKFVTYVTIRYEHRAILQNYNLVDCRCCALRPVGGARGWVFDYVCATISEVFVRRVLTTNIRIFCAACMQEIRDQLTRDNHQLAMFVLVRVIENQVNCPNCKQCNL